MAAMQIGDIQRDLHTLFSVGAIGDVEDGRLLERFASRGDQHAYAELVSRHGPMVRSVCRGVLRCPHAAEDAFQATFLILAQKAGTLRQAGALGGWLHRVARRAALQATADAARRRLREERAAAPEAQSSPGRGPWEDALPILHEEIARLPVKYREPLVLCDLESLSRDQAARRLGWPAGTVAGRLARGRDLLRTRLVRRGVAPAAVAGVFAAARESVAAAPVAEAVSVAGGTPAVAALVQAILRTMVRARIRGAVTTALAFGAALFGLAIAMAWALAPEKDGPTVPVTGQVVDPDGRPAAGVAVYESVRAGEGWGTIIAETKTDEQGRFQLAVPADGTRPEPTFGAIWAHQPGRLVASYPVRRGNVHADVPLRLALGPPANTTIEVRDPEGRPVAGANVAPRVLNRNLLSVPDGLAKRIAADTVTDARGRARLAAFLPEEVGTVMVSAPGFGSQQFGFGFSASEIGVGPKVVNLMPVGRVEGRVLGEPEIVRETTLTLMVWNTKSNPPPPPALGLFYLKPDAEGRFVVPEVPEGALSVSGQAAGSRWFAQATPELKVEPGKTTRVELKPAQGVRVRGVVRERGTGRPIAGVEISPYRGGDFGRSDAAGRFEFDTTPGNQAPLLRTIPAGYASLKYGIPHFNIPKDVAEFEMPPLELIRAGEVTGRVVDGRDRPVPGADVKASWQVDEGPQRQGPHDVVVTTDGRGAFTVAGIPLGGSATLTAGTPTVGRTTEPVTARSGDPAVLTLNPEGFVSMRGRVVDEEGKPVARARVHLQRQERYQSGQIKGNAPISFDGAYVLTTGDDGRYETPRGLDPDGEYAAVAEADGCSPVQTPWTRAAGGSFPDLVLRQERGAPTAVMEGMVRDRRGRPVAGATVWASFRGGPTQPARLTTDVQGRFRLEGIPADGALVFIEAPGFRFQGTAARPDRIPITVELTRADEPAPTMASLPPPLPRAEELALARRVMLPLAERVLKEKADDMTAVFQTLGVLAAVDPARVLEAVAAKPLKEGWFNDSLRSKTALGLFAVSPEKALAVAESIEDPDLQSSAFVRLCDRLPDSDREGKLRLLDRALLAARAAPDPGHQVVGVARVAEHWIGLGETDRAARLLREFEPVARALPTKGWDAFARGCFATELAAIDQEAALKLIEGLDEGDQPEPDRYRLNIAQELAGRDPAAAERVLDGLKKPGAIVLHGPRIVHAMAPKDKARARRVADRMNQYPEELRKLPFHHAYALGMMALALAETDRGAARGLLDEAYGELAGLALEGKRGFQDREDAATLGAALVPVAERIDPALVSEHFWRAASWRGTAPTSRSDTMPDAFLAFLLARYDREAARVILEPLVGRASSKPDAVAYHYLLEAVAAVDPRRAVAILDTIPDDPDAGLNPFRNDKNQMRLNLATALATPPEQRWDRALKELLRLWTVGREDIF